MRRAIRLGARVVADIVEFVDLEARGVQDLAVLVRAIPKVPWRVAEFVHDVVIVLAEMPPPGTRPWHAFRARFAAVHDASAHRPR